MRFPSDVILPVAWSLILHFLDLNLKNNISNKDLETKNQESHIYIYFYKYMCEEYKNNTSNSRVVIDYIAGMTDEFLLREYQEIENNLTKHY